MKPEEILRNHGNKMYILALEYSKSLIELDKEKATENIDKKISEVKKELV